MGSFSYLTISGYPILSFKNEYYHDVVDLIFLPEDYVEEKCAYSTKNKLFWGDSYIDVKGKFNFKGLRQSAKNCKKI